MRTFYLPQACYYKGISHHYVCLAETQRQAQELESFILNSGRLQVCPDWGLLAWKAVGRLARSGESNVVG